MNNDQQRYTFTATATPCLDAADAATGNSATATQEWKKLSHKPQSHKTQSHKIANHVRSKNIERSFECENINFVSNCK
jgi:hypothetical protein